MAVIGKYNSLKSMFYKTPALNDLSLYLSQALDSSSEIYRRILEVNGESKTELGHGIFAIEQKYGLKDQKQAFFESHLKYVDFQLIVHGEEFFLLGDRTSFNEKERRIESDLIVYEANFMASQIYLKAGDLAVFFENDVHSGGLALSGLEVSKMVYKSVVKVPKELLKLKF